MASSKENVFNANIASTYDEALPAHISAHYLEKRIHFFSRYLKPGAKILDVGCGTGTILAKLASADKSIKLYGCDNSADMIARADKRDNIYFTCSSSDKLPYKTGAFDVVVSVAVFHHLGSEAIASDTIRDMMRVTKRGGTSIIWDANPLNPYWLFLFKRVPYDREVKSPMPLPRIISNMKSDDISGAKIYRSGWIPDFIPRKMMGFFKFFEGLMEHIPFLNIFSAHNVVVLKKRM